MVKHKSMLQARLYNSLRIMRQKYSIVKKTDKSLVPVNVHEWCKPDLLYGLSPREIIWLYMHAFYPGNLGDVNNQHLHHHRSGGVGSGGRRGRR